MIDFDDKYRKAESYFRHGDYKNLELYFAKTLTKTSNIKLWELYLNYIRTVNKDSLASAYAYTIQKIWFHYDIYQILIDYIAILEDVEKIREVYNVGLSNPIHNLGLFFKNYEQFEMSLNKITAKSIINEKLPSYQNTFKLYQRLVPYLTNEFDSIDKIIELETDERKQKIMEYFIEKYSYREDLYFNYAEYLLSKCDDEIDEENESIIAVKNSLSQGISVTNSVFLKCYYAFVFKDASILDLKNESALICYLNILSQKGEVELCQGIEENFTENDNKINALDYAAKLYYSLTYNKNKTLEIYKKGVPMINDKMIEFYLSIYDLQTSRKIFEKYEISRESKQKLAFMEFCMGNLENLRKCFKKEEFYNEFKNLVTTSEEFVFDKLPNLEKSSAFQKLSSVECINLLKKLKLNF